MEFGIHIGRGPLSVSRLFLVGGFRLVRVVLWVLLLCLGEDLDCPPD